MSIKVDGLAREIAKCMEEYTGEVESALEETKKELARKGVKELKKTSPEGRRGRYRKGWTVKRVGSKRIIHNKTDYQLTHLLEKGHAMPQGGRSKAQEHIKPVEKELQESAVGTFKRKLGG